MNRKRKGDPYEVPLEVNKTDLLVAAVPVLVVVRVTLIRVVIAIVLRVGIHLLLLPISLGLKPRGILSSNWR